MLRIIIKSTLKVKDNSRWNSNGVKDLNQMQLQINDNIVTKTKNTGYREFSLLNASFSNTIKSKQSWAIKIKKINWTIYLGVYLKSKIIKYNFND